MQEDLNTKVQNEYDKLTLEEKTGIYELEKKVSKKNCITLASIFIPIMIVLLVISLFTQDLAFDILCYLFIEFFAFFLIIYIIKTIRKIRNKEFAIKTALRRTFLHEVYKESLENEIKQTTKIDSFKVDRIINITTKSIWQHDLLIDTNNKQFTFRGVDWKAQVFHFKDIINYEVFENGSSVVKGCAGSAIIGGAFFGVTGAVIGASRKRNVIESCDSLKLLIRINNLNHPLIEIPFITSKTDKNSITYQNCLKSIQEISACLEYMLNNKTLDNNVVIENLAPNPKTLKEQLKEIQDLFNEGLITEEEYNKMRENILK